MPLKNFWYYYNEEDEGKAIKYDWYTVSGAIASFNTEVSAPLRNLITNISYTQDLHGYSYPWPAGGGKNKFNGTFLQGYWAYADGGWVNSNGWIATEKIPCKPSTSYTASADAKLTRWQGFVWYDANGNYISTDNLQSNVNIGLTKTSPNNAYYLVFNIAGYPTSIDPISPSAVTHFQIEEGQTATSYTPYSNICPISGWTGANVTRCGKNFAEIDSAWIGSSGTHNGITWRFNEDGSMTLDGTKTTSTASVLIWNLANAARISGTQSDNKKHIPNGDYFIYSGHNKVVIQVYGSNNENAGASNSYGIVSGNLNPVRFTIDDTYKYNWIRLNIGGNAAFDNYTFYPMVRLASDTGTEQAPYTGDTYSITFPSKAGTVYGGTLDVTTGKLTVDRAMVDLGAKNWYPSTAAGRTRFRTSITDIERISSPNIVAPMLCSAYKTETANNTYTGKQGISLQQNAADVYVYDAQRESMTTSDFKTAMSGVQLCYKLATPQTYQLTPTEVTTLLGDNTIWADTGDVTVTYKDKAGKTITVSPLLSSVSPTAFRPALQIGEINFNDSDADDAESSSGESAQSEEESENFADEIMNGEEIADNGNEPASEEFLDEDVEVTEDVVETDSEVGTETLIEKNTEEIVEETAVEETTQETAEEVTEETAVEETPVEANEPTKNLEVTGR